MELLEPHAPDGRTVFIICNHGGSAASRRANHKLARLTVHGEDGRFVLDTEFCPDGGLALPPDHELELRCDECRLDVTVIVARLCEVAVAYHDDGVLPILLSDLVASLTGA